MLGVRAVRQRRWGVPSTAERVRRACDRWGLTVAETLAGGSRSAVFAATDRRGRDLVRLPVAAAEAGRLISTAREVRLLHGDFISKNLVSDTTAPTGWLAIDPLPMTGDPASEAASFAAYQPAGLILPFAERLARALDLDVHRVLRWSAIWTVHRVAQAWRDDQERLERLVESDQWRDLLLTS